MRRTHRFGMILALLFGIALLTALLTGCSALDELEESLYPTSAPDSGTSAQLPSETAPANQLAASEAAAPTLTWPAPTSTQAQATEQMPPAIPTVAPSQRLVFMYDGNVYTGDFLGANPAEAASAPQPETWAFRDGVIALAQGRNVDVIDLVGSGQASFQVNVPGEVEFAELTWGQTSAALLYNAIVTDQAATTFGHSVELRVLNPQNGAELGAVHIPDANGASILRYEESAGRIALIVRGGDPSFAEVSFYDVKSGQRIAAFAAQGQGEAAFSPDGRYLLAQQEVNGVQQMALYDLTTPAGSAPRIGQYPANGHGVEHVWSPDSRMIAFLLREGQASSEETTQGLGVWVLDVATMESKKALDEVSLSATLFGWTPDSAYIVGYHRSENEAYYYAVRPDGGDRRILTLEPKAELLGWMSPVERSAKIVVDPWRARFASTQADSNALAQTLAQWALEQTGADEQTLASRVQQYLQASGGQKSIGALTLKRISEAVYIAQIPPYALYLLDNGHAQEIGSGNILLDVRLQGQDLGLIYGMAASGPVQPTYSLLRRQADGSWQMVWTPQGRRDWIATDGQIQFAGEGLGTLQVVGTSFGLDFDQDQVFSECQACPHRQLVATWTRQGDTYERQTSLVADAPQGSIYWEMTQRTAYAIVYETLRRARRELSIDDLVADPSLAGQIRDLGLADSTKRFLVEEETAEKVRFQEIESQTHYEATVQGQRLVRIERLP